VILWRWNKRQTALRLPGIPCLCIAETTSSRIKSGCLETSVSSQSAYSSNGDALPPRGLAAQHPVSRKHFTHLTAALGLISNCSAASRREAPLSTRAMTRPRISAEYAFGIVRPPENRINADRLTHPQVPGNPRFYWAGTCSRWL